MSHARLFTEIEIPEELKQNFAYYRKKEFTKACFLGGLSFFTYCSGALKKDGEGGGLLLTAGISLVIATYSYIKSRFDYAMITDSISQETLKELKTCNYKEREQVLRPRIQ